MNSIILILLFNHSEYISRSLLSLTKNCQIGHEELYVILRGEYSTKHSILIPFFNQSEYINRYISSNILLLTKNYELVNNELIISYCQEYKIYHNSVIRSLRKNKSICYM